MRALEKLWPASRPRMAAIRPRKSKRSAPDPDALPRPVLPAPARAARIALVAVMLGFVPARRVGRITARQQRTQHEPGGEAERADCERVLSGIGAAAAIAASTGIDRLIIMLMRPFARILIMLAGPFAGFVQAMLCPLAQIVVAVGGAVAQVAIGFTRPSAGGLDGLAGRLVGVLGIGVELCAQGFELFLDLTPRLPTRLLGDLRGRACGLANPRRRVGGVGSGRIGDVLCVVRCVLVLVVGHADTPQLRGCGDTSGGTRPPGDMPDAGSGACLPSENASLREEFDASFDAAFASRRYARSRARAARAASRSPLPARPISQPIPAMTASTGTGLSRRAPIAQSTTSPWRVRLSEASASSTMPEAESLCSMRWSVCSRRARERATSASISSIRRRLICASGS